MIIIPLNAFEVVSKTEPMSWSMLKLLGAPPDKVHDKVADWPLAMLAGTAVKVEITGGN